MILAKSLVFFLLFRANLGQIVEVIHGLDRATDFALKHSQEINFDGLLGFVIAEAQLLQSLKLTTDYQTVLNLGILLHKLETIRMKITPNLPKSPPKMLYLEKYLLNPTNWITNENYKFDSLRDLGIYRNWTVDDIIKNKHASYKGIPSDYCLMEILKQNCYVSPFCNEMMLAPRIDKGYLLSHRVFYLQIVRLKGCGYNHDTFGRHTNKICSLMLREIRTNGYLGFPAHDIALEQMVLCGIEGYLEFVSKEYRSKVLLWQMPYGCYKSERTMNSKRSSNVIAYGCSDHTTGLGAAALALNLKYLLS